MWPAFTERDVWHAAVTLDTLNDAAGRLTISALMCWERNI
jgi:hypothetical protein